MKKDKYALLYAQVRYLIQLNTAFIFIFDRSRIGHLLYICRWDILKNIVSCPTGEQIFSQSSLAVKIGEQCVCTFLPFNHP